MEQTVNNPGAAGGNLSDPHEGMDEMMDHLEARAALSAAAKPVEQWRPIETAPKDGTDVLVHAAGSTYAVSWCEEAEGWVVDDNKHGPYRLRGSYPTHWMPLPSAPGAEQAKPVQAQSALTLALLEYFHASESFQMTLGHAEATAEDENKAEARWSAATSAARAAVAAAIRESVGITKEGA